MNQEELETILGGAPKAVVTEFPKVGELSEDDLDFPAAGYTSPTTASDYQFNHLQKEDVFRQSAVEREKAAMFQELEQSQQEPTTQRTI